jgi:hypothetical protein
MLRARGAACCTQARGAARPLWAAGSRAGVVRFKARCAARDPKCAWFRSRPVVQVWYDAGVVSACGRQPDRDRPERRTRPCNRPLRARDRRLFDSYDDALAAADGQAVGRATQNVVCQMLLVPSTKPVGHRLA